MASIKLFAVEDIISGLKKLFENIMKQGYKLEDKCLRNEILILLNYLMRDEKVIIKLFGRLYNTLLTNHQLMQYKLRLIF